MQEVSPHSQPPTGIGLPKTRRKLPRLIIGCAVVALLAGPVLVKDRLFDEPVVNGKRLGSWLADLESDTAEQREAAEQAIRSLGTEATERIVADLTAHDSFIRASLIDLARSQPFFATRLSTVEERRRRARLAILLVDQGPEASIPMLIMKLRDPSSEVRVLAARQLAWKHDKTNTLGAIGPLIACLEDPASSVRSITVRALQKLQANEACQPLLDRLHDDDPGVRAIAAEALGDLDCRSPQVVLGLTESISDSQRATRLNAIRSLAKIGTNALSAVPTLFQMIRDNDPLASVSAGALRDIAPETAAHEIIGYLKQQDPMLRRNAAASLPLFGIASKDAIPLLRSGLRDESSFVREAFASALGWMEPVENETIEALIAVLDDEFQHVRRAASNSLGSIGPAAARAVPALKKRLNDPAHEVRAWAYMALARIDPNADPGAVPVSAPLKRTNKGPVPDGPPTDSPPGSSGKQQRTAPPSSS
jgi:HEAT repeat protein